MVSRKQPIGEGGIQAPESRELSPWLKMHWQKRIQFSAQLSARGLARYQEIFRRHSAGGRSGLVTRPVSSRLFRSLPLNSNFNLTGWNSRAASPGWQSMDLLLARQPRTGQPEISPADKRITPFFFPPAGKSPSPLPAEAALPPVTYEREERDSHSSGLLQRSVQHGIPKHRIEELPISGNSVSGFSREKPTNEGSLIQRGPEAMIPASPPVLAPVALEDAARSEDDQGKEASEGPAVSPSVLLDAGSGERNMEVRRSAVSPGYTGPRVEKASDIRRTRSRNSLKKTDKPLVLKRRASPAKKVARNEKHILMRAGKDSAGTRNIIQSRPDENNLTVTDFMPVINRGVETPAKQEVFTSRSFVPPAADRDLDLPVQRKINVTGLTPPFPSVNPGGAERDDAGASDDVGAGDDAGAGELNLHRGPVVSGLETAPSPDTRFSQETKSRVETGPVRTVREGVVPGPLGRAADLALSPKTGVRPLISPKPSLTSFRKKEEPGVTGSRKEEGAGASEVKPGRDILRSTGSQAERVPPSEGYLTADRSLEGPAKGNEPGRSSQSSSTSGGTYRSPVPLMRSTLEGQSASVLNHPVVDLPGAVPVGRTEVNRETATGMPGMLPSVEGNAGQQPVDIVNRLPLQEPSAQPDIERAVPVKPSGNREIPISKASQSGSFPALSKKNMELPVQRSFKPENKISNRHLLPLPSVNPGEATRDDARAGELNLHRGPVVSGLETAPSPDTRFSQETKSRVETGPVRTVREGAVPGRLGKAADLALSPKTGVRPLISPKPSLTSLRKKEEPGVISPRKEEEAGESEVKSGRDILRSTGSQAERVPPSEGYLTADRFREVPDMGTGSGRNAQPSPASGKVYRSPIPLVQSVPEERPLSAPIQPVVDLPGVVPVGRTEVNRETATGMPGISPSVEGSAGQQPVDIVNRLPLREPPVQSGPGPDAPVKLPGDREFPVSNVSQSGSFPILSRKNISHRLVPGPHPETAARSLTTGPLPLDMPLAAPLQRREDSGVRPDERPSGNSSSTTVQRNFTAGGPEGNIAAGPQGIATNTPNLKTGQVSQPPPSSLPDSPSGSPGPDLRKLARELYPFIRKMIIIDKERLPL